MFFVMQQVQVQPKTHSTLVLTMPAQLYAHTKTSVIGDVPSNIYLQYPSAFDMNYCVIQVSGCNDSFDWQQKEVGCHLVKLLL